MSVPYLNDRKHYRKREGHGEQALEEELEARRWKRAVSRLDNASTIEARTLPASGRLAGGRRAGDSPRGGIAHLLCVRL